MELQVSLGQIRAFLLSRGWIAEGSDSRMEAMAPPIDLGLPKDFKLYLPKSEEHPVSQGNLRRLCAIVADIYDVSEADVPTIVTNRDTVLAIQLRSPDYETGSVPFLYFEGLVEKLKKTLLHTASFVLTDAPTVEAVPDEALSYLTRCRFLQSAIGSYVARVQLPDKYPLVEPTLFNPEVQSSEVNETLFGAIRFVTGSVFGHEADLFSDASLERHASVMNVDVLRDVGELLQRSGAKEINFTFASGDGVRSVSSGPLTADRFEILNAYVAFARERLAADHEIDVVGRIVELRSRHPDRRRNHVGIAASIDGREVLISLSMGRQDYPYAVMAHNRNRLVRIRGSVRRLRTQWRVERLDSFEELADPADTSGV
jgi:hypothetical protein